jgi:hypothetical protein
LAGFGLGLAGVAGTLGAAAGAVGGGVVEPVVEVGLAAAAGSSVSGMAAGAKGCTVAGLAGVGLALVADWAWAVRASRQLAKVGSKVKRIIT